MSSFARKGLVAVVAVAVTSVLAFGTASAATPHHSWDWKKRHPRPIPTTVAPAPIVSKPPVIYCIQAPCPGYPVPAPKPIPTTTTTAPVIYCIQAPCPGTPIPVPKPKTIPTTIPAPAPRIGDTSPIRCIQAPCITPTSTNVEIGTALVIYADGTVVEE